MNNTERTALEELPPLPEARKPDPNGLGWFTAGQMRSYARAALAAKPETPADQFSAKDQPNFRDVCQRINETPLLQSLLYDINLLPEQITQAKHYEYMCAVVNHMFAALAQPAQPEAQAEPVECMLRRKRDGFVRGHYSWPRTQEELDFAELDGDEYLPLYASPPTAAPEARQPLSEERIAKLRVECSGQHSGTLYVDLFARAIERAHGITAKDGS